MKKAKIIAFFLAATLSPFSVNNALSVDADYFYGKIKSIGASGAGANSGFFYFYMEGCSTHFLNGQRVTVVSFSVGTFETNDFIKNAKMQIAVGAFLAKKRVTITYFPDDTSSVQSINVIDIGTVPANLPEKCLNYN